MIFVTWEELKAQIDTLGIQVTQLSHIDLGNRCIVWIDLRGIRLIVPEMYKTSSDWAEFNAGYESKSNTKEAQRVRITTNKIGSRMHQRFMTFQTSCLGGNIDNTDWRDADYGDAHVIMVDASKQVTTNPALCKETWLDWMPPCTFEIAGGWVYVPKVLLDQAGGPIPFDNDTHADLDLWEIHAVGAPDIPAQYGGDVHFIANPRLKWLRGQLMDIDAMLNPAEMPYNGGIGSNKIRFVIKHPVGAQVQLQVKVTIFR